VERSAASTAHTGAVSPGWGWRVVFVSGLLPALNGLLMLALSLWSATGGRNGPWISLVGRHSFSAAALQRMGTDLEALWLLNFHLCGANLAMSGVTILVVSSFALREGKRWAWFFLWGLILWVGGNDAVALVHYHMTVGSGAPYAVIPLTIGSAGLILHQWENRVASLQ
jgi:hypothetical protein